MASPQDYSTDSEDERIEIRTGRIPRNWYDSFQHQGYDIKASQVLKCKQSSLLDSFIARNENPSWWRTIKDELNNKEIVLNDEQLEVLQRISKGKFAGKEIANEDDYIIDSDIKPGKLSSAPIPKRAFLPSKWERIKVNKLVQAIKLGRLDPNPKKEKPKEILFDIWGNEESETTGKKPPKIEAPKMKLPGHAESYNPSEEYLFNKDEEAKWLADDPEDRELDFLPHKSDCLRKVKSYDNLIKERFERCLDLYLCPRIKKKKLNIDPENLIPKLPKISELRPFPTMQNFKYKGHNSRVRSLSVHKSGFWLATLDQEGEAIVWEVMTGRILKRYKLEGVGYSLDFSLHGILAICSGSTLSVYNPSDLSDFEYERNDQALEESKNSYKEESLIPWEFFENKENEKDLKIKINFKNEVKYVVFHAKGDYLATICPEAGQGDIVIVHSLEKASSERPFNKSKSDVSKVVFHPSKPILFIMTKKNVFVYNLQKQMLVKKLISGAQWNSCLAIHPKGDNLITGSYDKKVCWFDLDSGSTPYKTLKYHKKAVRQVIFHTIYPLFATCSDDGTINIFHGMAYNDLMMNALIVPLKILKGHSIKDDLGVLDIAFHPKQPWIFSSGADGEVILWT